MSTPTEDTPAHFQHALELCQLCHRLLPRTGRCRAIEVLDLPRPEHPWARFIVAPYADDDTGTRHVRLAKQMRRTTDAAELYRLGESDHCEAFRPKTTSPADEGDPRRTA